MKEADAFLGRLYERYGRKENRERLKEKLREKLGYFFEEGSFDPETQEVSDFPEYRRERMTIRTAEGLICPFYVLTPKLEKETLPAVLAIHGHGEGMNEAAGVEKGSAEQRDPGIHGGFAVGLVKQGMKVFVPELIGMGERMLTKDVEQNKGNSCYTLAAHLLMFGKSLAGLRYTEMKRMIDFIVTVPDADPEHIGVMGFSGGG